MAKDLAAPEGVDPYAPPAAPRDIGEALAALSEDDLLRLRAIARLRARSLPGGVSWSDLLHEAVVHPREA
jgi:RNA polymerase sigma-70 factor (ECF subfamily)